METTSELLATALAHHQAGRLADAERIGRQILAAEPRHADAWNLLGALYGSRGDFDAAIDAFCRAIGSDPKEPSYHCNLASVYLSLERPHDAVASYRHAIQARPDASAAHFSLGKLLHQQDELEEAIACYRRAIELDPNDAFARNVLGNALQQSGKLGEAADCYRRAIELKPTFPEAYNNLGALVQQQHNLDDAVVHYRHALELKPNYAKALNNLGAALEQLWKWDEAIDCFRRAIQLEPDYANAHYNLALSLREVGQRDEAIASYRRTLELNPRHAGAHYNLGNALQELGRPDEAVDCYRRTLELDSHNSAALAALVHELQHLCQWGELPALSERVIAAVDQDAARDTIPPISPFSFLTLPIATTAEQQLRCARQWVDRQLKLPTEFETKIAPPPRPTRKPRITVGYLSADFRTHATALLIAELFEKHDHDRFAIHGYSYGADDGSPMRRRLVDAFDRFVDVKKLTFIEAAQSISADEVDILVDLKGYTADARTQIVALRPAPIQVNYLGYPGTMGAPFVDYILVDDFIVPAEQQPFFSEKLVHLPGCYQVNDGRREIAAHTPTRAECGLPEQGFVFCSFNNSYKITPQIFAAWMRLLAAVPGSVLWLFEANQFAAANLRNEAQARGIAAERLVFAPRLAPPEHLARHRLADLFLDTLPVGAHTTASDALWTGCPLVTLAGDTFVSRVAGSLLRAVGLDELVTTSLAEYEALALQLAKNPEKLAELRARLHANRATSPLFDAGQFARSLEQAYATMWEIYCSGDPPRPIRVERPES